MPPNARINCACVRACVVVEVVQSLLQYNCDAARQWRGPGGQSCSLVGLAVRHGHDALLPLLASVGAACTAAELAAAAPRDRRDGAGWLRRAAGDAPPPLQQLCRRRVRRQLSCDIRHEVQRLPLPSRLRQYLVQVP